MVKISGDELKATSDVLVLYKDLKVTLLEKDSGKKELDKKNVTTLLANLFVIKMITPKEVKSQEEKRENLFEIEMQVF